MSTVDSIIAIKIVTMLLTPFDQWEAYKEGFITADGTRTDKIGTSDNWTMLHRLVWRLKLLLKKIPGGNSNIGQLTAAYLLVREYYEHNKTEEGITESTLLSYKKEASSFKSYCEFKSILEEAPANVVGNVAGATGEPGDIPPARFTKKKKRKQKNDSISVDVS